MYQGQRAFVGFSPKSLLDGMRSERVASLVEQHASGITIESIFGDFAQLSPEALAQATTQKRVLGFLERMRPRHLEIIVDAPLAASMARSLEAIDLSRVSIFDFSDSQRQWQMEHYVDHVLRILVATADTLGDLILDPIATEQEPVYDEAEAARLLPTVFPKLGSASITTWPTRRRDAELLPVDGQRRVRLSEAILERAPNLEHFSTDAIRLGYDDTTPENEAVYRSACETTQRLFARELARQQAYASDPSPLNASKLKSLSLDSIETGLSWPAPKPYPTLVFPELKELTEIKALALAKVYNDCLDELPPNVEFLHLIFLHRHKMEDGTVVFPALDQLFALLAADSKWMPRLRLLLLDYNLGGKSGKSEYLTTEVKEQLHLLCSARGVKLEFNDRKLELGPGHGGEEENSDISSDGGDHTGDEEDGQEDGQGQEEEQDGNTVS